MIENTLILACMNGDIDAVSILLKNGADVNAIDNGFTALMMVSNCDADFINIRYYQLEYEIRNRIKIIKLLCEYGANINATDDDGNTALDFEEISNFQDIWNDIIILLKRCAIEQIIPKFTERQKDQTKLGWMLRGIKVKNRGMRFPYDLEYYIRGFIG